jgi:Ca2+/Na+ antiporter
MNKLFQLYPSRAEAMRHETALIYTTAVSDCVIALVLIVIGSLILASRGSTNSTAINKPLGFLLVLLGIVFLELMVSIWQGIYWMIALTKVLAWGCAIWTIGVLPKSIAQRRANDKAVQDMKTKIADLEKLKDEVTNGKHQ